MDRLSYRAYMFDDDQMMSENVSTRIVMTSIQPTGAD